MKSVLRVVHYVTAGIVLSRLLLGVDPSLEVSTFWRWTLPALMLICVVTGFVHMFLLQKEFTAYILKQVRSRSVEPDLEETGTEQDRKFDVIRTAVNKLAVRVSDLEKYGSEKSLFEQLFGSKF